ncbi:hypothetical protein [Lentzea cavernae]|uniref:Uncharacterized protein n=1 Tax=Lentzea cavernae TaxID=2020703 RepID=A0ABQ3MHR5_9PSEU|nr:hypothetical protein [Lentzea cavernae]GHH44198.1 hypothetical protein GCM10017774_43360 [Lentzea cavernae]
MILRIYPPIRTDTVVDEASALIRRVEAESGVRHVLVDLMYLDELAFRLKWDRTGGLFGERRSNGRLRSAR